MTTAQDGANQWGRMPAPKLRATIYWLALDWIHLHTTMPSPARTQTGRASPTREYGHPAEWASDKTAQIADTLTSWHDMLAEHRNETRPRRKRMRQHRDGYDLWQYADHEQKRVVSAWTYLEPRIEQLVTLVDREPLQELVDLHNQIREALGATKPRYVLPVPCPKIGCGLIALTRIQGIGQDFITCGQCGYTIRDTYYPLLVRMALDTLVNTNDEIHELY